MPNTPRDYLTVRFGVGEVTGVFVDETTTFAWHPRPGLPGLSQAPAFNFMNMLSEFKASDDSSALQMAAIFLGEGESEASEIALEGYDKERLNAGKS